MSAPGRVPPAINCHGCSQAVDLSGLEGFSEVECPYCHAALVVPVEFGNFLIQRAQGAGGMGTVYRALDMSLHRYVALKVLKPGLAADPQFIESFTREARAAAAVTHINVAQVYTFGEHEGHYFIAMELLEQGSLDDRITQQGKLPEADVLNIGAQIAAGLGAAYDRGLLHRDVKPGNILFDAENVPKVVDFGLARGRGTRADQPANEAPQQVWGTPYYIAPEKMRGHVDDLRSDIYSLGATLFHAIAGRPPFEAATATDVAVKHTTQPVTSLKSFVPGIQDATARTIGRMLAKNPAERYHSYADVIADLEAAKTALQSAAAQPTIVTDTGERISTKSLILTLAGLGVAIALIVLAIVFRERLFGPPSPPTSVLPPVPSPTAPPAPAPVESKVSFQVEMPWGRSWFVAGNEAEQGNLDGARQAFDNVRRLVRDLPAYPAWVAAYEGMVLLALERPAESRPLLAQATNGLASLDLPATITTTNFIGMVAAGLLGAVPMNTLENAASSMPPWAGGITQFAVGLKRLSDGELKEAVVAFRASERLFDPTHGWVFALQPLARRLDGECEAALNAIHQSATDPEAALRQVRGAIAETKHTGIQAKLRERETQLMELAQQRRQEQERRAAAARQAEEKRRAEEERRRAADEAQIVQVADPAAKALWQQWDFAGARAKYEEIAPQVQTATARTQVEHRVAVLRVLEQFKAQLIADIARQPYVRGDLTTAKNAALPGQLAKANDRELVFTLPYGETIARWGDFAPQTLGRLADHYAQTLGPTDRADLAGRRQLMLAVFCRQFGLERFVAGYEQQALKLQPALKAELGKLLAQ